MTERNPLQAKRLTGFSNAAQSLKLYRRADLHSDEDDRSLIEDLYVDPLPGREVLENLLRPHTVFLVGRKGTGKSTIFQRAQHEIRKKSNSTSAYVDIKTVYEQSEIDTPLLDKLDQTDLALPKDAVRRFLLYKAFLLAVIEDVRNELQQKIQTTFWARLKAKLFSTVDEVLERLDEVINKAKNADFANVTGLLTQAVNLQKTAQADIKVDGTTSVGFATAPSATATFSASHHENLASSDAQAFTHVLIRVLNVKGLLTELSAILEQTKIRHLHIFIDDFSELPEDAMRIVVDSLLAPLNNWSNELIKFKIAAYPGRIYLGDIDRTKIDEISLDMYSLYGRTDVASMEEKATDFVRRLVQARIAYFCECEFEDFFRARSSSEDEETIWRRLFYATMANPRNLGYILHFLYADVLIHGDELSLFSINKAAQRYFDEKIEPFFAMSRFTHLSFQERSSVYSLKELLERFVSRARITQREMRSEIMQKVSSTHGRPPTSHFHVITAFDSLLSTLELNFFVTKYYEMKDRDGREVSVYALNFGLCERYSIAFGRPRGFRQARLYFVERVFDYSAIVRQHLQENQEIKCSNCGSIFDFEQLEAIRMFAMRCPSCQKGKCEVVNLSRKYDKVLRDVDENLLLPGTELGILQTLHSEKRELYPAEIARELDCSHQLVGRRGRNLSQRKLIERRDVGNRRVYEITEEAERTYFPESKGAELQVD